MSALRHTWQAFYRAWMRFAHVLGIINTTVLLTLVYLVVVLPTRAFWWVLRKDPLVLRRAPFTTLWIARDQDEPTLEERRHPF